MRDPVLDEKRLQLADALKGHLWQAAAQQPGPIDDLVVVVADEADQNARVLLHSLGFTANASQRGDMNISAVVMPRDKAVAAVAPYDEDLAEKLKTPTPMKLTALIVAHGGWSVCGLGRNVGLA